MEVRTVIILRLEVMKICDKRIFEVSTITTYGTFKKHSSKQANKEQSQQHKCLRQKTCKCTSEIKLATRIQRMHCMHVSMATIPHTAK